MEPGFYIACRFGAWRNKKLVRIESACMTENEAVTFLEFLKEQKPKKEFYIFEVKEQ